MIMPSSGVHVTLPDYYSPENGGQAFVFCCSFILDLRLSYCCLLSYTVACCRAALTCALGYCATLLWANRSLAESARRVFFHNLAVGMI